MWTYTEEGLRLFTSGMKSARQSDCRGFRQVFALQLGILVARGTGRLAGFVEGYGQVAVR